MSSQEMFPPQENRPPRQDNTDPPEQPPGRQSWREEAPGAGQAPYEEGYSGTRPAMDWMSDEGEKMRPLQPQSMPAWQWLLIILVVLLVILAITTIISAIFSWLFGVLGVVIAAIVIAKWGFGKTIALSPRNFAVNGPPTLVIRNPVGPIRIRPGAANRVDIQGSKHVSSLFDNGNNDGVMVNYTQNGNTITVESVYTSGIISIGRLGHINLDIAMPEFSNVQIKGDADTIHVEGIHGQVQVKTNAGTIHVQQTILEGQSSLTTNAGTIHVQQTMLKGQVNFHTNAGTISFAGELDPQGYYRFGTNMGLIDVVLPADSSFILAAATNLGSVHNQFGRATVGSAPHAGLELRSSLGPVNVRRG